MKLRHSLLQKSSLVITLDCMPMAIMSSSFEKTGLMEAAKGYYRNLGDTSTQLDFTTEFMPKVGVSKKIMEADGLISLPKFKTHGLTVMTGAIKNSYGILPGAQKAKLHRIAGSPQRFHDAIVDVFRLRIPDLLIIDAVVGMEGNGPALPVSAVRRYVRRKQ